ncbi:folate/biopterin family MFS transporter [Ruegeria sediminis]|uniref:Folate/biopterin family MFS transporter n=1 Tax=Ruegeria sediminis TaxID=2583820 RepID=A0ABY2WVA0_9RHOB|nr:folate/biopterin family MFS transporter [Ruegeria sediminis]TMV06539.1 folate/biopterin family MFS transporter [Ruegeria sediminis]
MTAAARLWHWFDAVVLDLGRQFRWSFLPPLMIYFAAGAQGLTAIVGTFFVKEYLDVSAAFIAGIAFWAGLPWALKMPLGHLVDLIWRWKALLIYVGAALIACSFLIMFGLATRVAWMPEIMSMTAWYVFSVILAPCGYVVQDAVADAMSVEAVPRHDAEGRPLDKDTERALHTTMQTLGRFALIGGASTVALLNIWLFAGIEALPAAEKEVVYGEIYLLALLIPCISISGVLLAGIQKRLTIRRLIQQGMDAVRARAHFDPDGEPVKANHWYFTGGAVFVAMTLTVGLMDLPFSQEIVFAGSMAIVLTLMRQLIRNLTPAKARALVGTAIIVFVFRAVPLNGAAATWFEIDVLGFDQQFLSVLYLITSVLTLVGMVILRPMMASKTIADIVIILSIAAGLLSLPGIGLYYGIHHWTSAMTGGVVDARFIAVLNTAIESPLGQISMIPMLAWIARNAPPALKATFFAVMASFTNLALSASSLGTKYLNQIFTVTREVAGPDGAITTSADYSELGVLMITVATITVLAPVLAVWIVQRSFLRTTD